MHSKTTTGWLILCAFSFVVHISCAVRPDFNGIHLELKGIAVTVVIIERTRHLRGAQAYAFLSIRNCNKEMIRGQDDVGDIQSAVTILS